MKTLRNSWQPSRIFHAREAGFALHIRMSPVLTRFTRSLSAPLQEISTAMSSRDTRTLDPARPPVNRIFSHPGILAWCVLAMIIVMVMINYLAPEDFAIILLDNRSSTFPLTVQTVMWVAFGFGLGELIVRWRDARREQAELHRGYLPEDEKTILQAPQLRPIYQAARQSVENGGGFLPRLIQRVVIQFQTSRSIDQANGLLNSSLEMYLHEIDLRYAVVRYIVWLIPTLGFIGTVVGISIALAFAGEADTQDPALLAELTKRLAVAFNTTLLALVMSAILVLIQHIVEAREERALNQAGQYCLDNLINRLYER